MRRFGWTALLLLAGGCTSMTEERVRSWNADGVYLFRQGDFLHAREIVQLHATLTGPDGQQVPLGRQRHHHLAAAFLGAAFFVAALGAPAAARLCAQRRRSASWMAFRPAALSRRFFLGAPGFGALGVFGADVSGPSRTLAHLFC